MMMSKLAIRPFRTIRICSLVKQPLTFHLFFESSVRTRRRRFEILHLASGSLKEECHFPPGRFLNCAFGSGPAREGDVISCPPPALEVLLANFCVRRKFYGPRGGLSCVPARHCVWTASRILPSCHSFFFKRPFAWRE